MTKIFMIALVLFVYLSGCKTITCSNTYITPAFIGFSVSDIDTFVVRQYKPNDNFLHLIDTTLFINNVNVINAVSNDTTIVHLNNISGEEKYIMPGSDWQIYIPSKNRTISILGIISTQKEHRCFGDECGCVNPINSFIQDGQSKIPQVGYIQYWGDGYLTYINN